MPRYETTEPAKYGFYSAAFDQTYGSVIWEAADGVLVTISFVSRYPDASDFGWPDKELRGMVVKCHSGRLRIPLLQPGGKAEMK
jgi:hypothetical protein